MIYLFFLPSPAGSWFLLFSSVRFNHGHVLLSYFYQTGPTVFLVSLGSFTVEDLGPRNHTYYNPNLNFLEHLS